MRKQQFQQPSQQEYDVQRIIAERKLGNKTYYLVKWKGYSHDQNTWEPICHLKNVPQKIRQWKNTRSKQPSRKQEKNRAKQTQPQLSSNAGQKTKFIHKTNNKISNGSSLSGNKNTTQQKQTEAEQTEQRIQIQEAINKLQKGLDSKLKPGRDNTERSIFNEMKPLESTTMNPAESKLQKSKMKNDRSSKLRDTSRRLKERDFVSSQQHELKKPSILIQISDSSRQQSSEVLSKISEQEEQIIEQSASYSQKGNQAVVKIDPPQLFLNIELPKTDMCQQKLQTQNFFKTETFLTKRHAQKERFLEQFNAQLSFHKSELVLQNQYLKNLIHQNSFKESVLGNQRMQINYEKLCQIAQIYKEKGVLYCNLNDKNGLTVQKVTYQSIQANRPDLLTNLFKGRFPK